MGVHDNAGRIPRKVYLISTIVMLVICSLSTLARLYIRLVKQKEVSLDDGFTILAFFCLIAGITIFYTIIDEQYLIEDITFGGLAAFSNVPANWLDKAVHFENMVVISLMCTWASISCVKFSFLFFFKKLIVRVQSMIYFWWFTMIVTLGVCIYGFSVYELACEDKSKAKLLECGIGSKRKLAVRYALAQMILDVFSDVLILSIPVRLIWKVQVRWTQKVALCFSLCLTVIMITVTIIRVSGLQRNGALDSAWETYWQIISAEVGITMTAITAFRTLFVSTVKKSRERGQATNLRSTMQGLLNLLLTPRRWYTRGSRSATNGEYKNNELNPVRSLPLVVPRPNMTGVRTFVNARGGSDTQGFSRMDKSQEIRTLPEENVDDEIWLRGRSSDFGKGIKVQHDVWSSSDRISKLPSAMRRNDELV